MCVDVCIWCRIPVSPDKSRSIETTNKIRSVVATGIARTFYLGKVTSPEFDKTWYGFDVYAWSVAECNVAIMCACAPSLKSITGRFFRSTSGRSGSNNDTGRGSGHGGTRDLENGRNIQPVDFMKILTLHFRYPFRV